MVLNHISLSISDASWAKFVNMLEYKKLWHDRVLQKVGTFILHLRLVIIVVLLGGKGFKTA